MATPDSSSETTAQESDPSLPLGRAGAEGRDLSGRSVGDFEVERLLGRGGMGEVYLARQVSLNRPVALKVLRADLLSNPAYLARFEAEAAIAAKLNHPNIVHIYSLGAVDGLRFIAMEYVQGTTLRDYVTKKGALDLPLAMSIMRQTAQAVGAAGELGLIHRDIKPENLLLTKKGQVKVADFGLARSQDEPAHHLTQPGVAMGTPMYMSPEQVQGHKLDHRSDLYSMGVTFYHMLTGQPPFRAETAWALALKHVRDLPAAPRVFRPDLPADLEAIVVKLMAKRPEDRYQSAAEMLRDLARYRESLPQNATQTSAVSLEVPTVAAPEPKPAPKPRVPLRERFEGLKGVKLGGPALAVLLATATVAGLVAGYLRRAPDLLGPGAPQAAGPALLWLAPSWEDIERRPTPEAQYRFAQMVASDDQLEAAWLAVPGHHPTARDWSTRAYTQLARMAFRRRDSDRLRAIQAELGGSGRSGDQALARIAGAGARLSEGDLQGVIADLNEDFLSGLVDAALVELSLEVAIASNRAVSGGDAKPTVRQKLNDLQRGLTLMLLGLGIRDSR